jgi:endonuclease YncB( thermonuclease family)
MPRPQALAAAALLLIAIALASAWAVLGPEATVVAVGDGDSIRVRKGGTVTSVRLACIDAPELVQQPYGEAARHVLEQRLPIGGAVRLNEKTTDRHGRLVAEVFKGVNINLAMVEDGHAFAFRKYLSHCDAREFLDAEFRASRRRYGVWRVEGGITRPWEFRRQHEELFLRRGRGDDLKRTPKPVQHEQA